MKSYAILLFACLIISCKGDDKSDAYGNFEATTITVSAKGNGELMRFDLQEGQVLKEDVLIGLIDTTNLHLEKLKLQAQIDALDLKLQEAAPEISVLLKDRINLVRERNRTSNLVAQKAATEQQLDDLNGRIELLNQRISATQQNINLTNRAILAERKPLEAQIAILDKQIQDQIIRNPIKGTVLTKYMEPHELVSSGLPLYKIANLEEMDLVVYTSAALLSSIKLGDEVTILVDKNEDELRRLTGKIIWIASEAEFTPKTIETREERVNLVYAVKVRLQNDGLLKIGMPAEVVFNKSGS